MTTTALTAAQAEKLMCPFKMDTQAAQQYGCSGPECMAWEKHEEIIRMPVKYAKGHCKLIDKD